MELFKDPLFWGMGEHSAALAWDLTQQFSQAMDLQSGLQQPDHPESEEEARDCKRWRSEEEGRLESLVRSIVVALGQEHLLKDQSGLEKHKEQEKRLARLNAYCLELETSIRKLKAATSTVQELTIRPWND